MEGKLEIWEKDLLAEIGGVVDLLYASGLEQAEFETHNYTIYRVPIYTDQILVGVRHNNSDRTAIIAKITYIPMQSPIVELVHRDETEDINLGEVLNELFEKYGNYL